MRDRGRAARGAAAAVATTALLLAGCSGDDEPSVTAPTSEPRPVVFPPGEIVWAQGSTIHVGERTYDVSPHEILAMDWTPYVLYLTLTDHPLERNGFAAEYDGSEVRKLDDVYSDIVTSADGTYAAWIERSESGPLDERLARLVVIDAATGDTVFRTSEGMGAGEEHLSDLYAEQSPYVRAFRGDELLWHQAINNSDLVTTDLATGRSTSTSDWLPSKLGLTSGTVFSSPDGKYTVNHEIQHQLRIKPRQPTFGHRWQVPGGWLDDHTLLVLAQDRYKGFRDLEKPDRTPGFFLSCDLDLGTCREIGRVIGADDVVFPGFSGGSFG